MCQRREAKSGAEAHAVQTLREEPSLRPPLRYRRTFIFPLPKTCNQREPGWNAERVICPQSCRKKIVSNCAHGQSAVFGGEMAEWLKAHAWKACILQKGIEGSNPSLSASF